MNVVIHPVHFDADNVKPGAREEVDDVPGAAGGESEIIGLDQDQGALRHFTGLISKRVLQEPAIRVGKLRPDF